MVGVMLKQLVERLLMATVACVYCRRSHMTCDSGRPCSRCVKRNIGHLCHDEVKESKAKSPKKEAEASPMSSHVQDTTEVQSIPKTDSQMMKPPSGPAAYNTSVSANPVMTPTQLPQVHMSSSPRENPAPEIDSTHARPDSETFNELPNGYDSTLFALPQDAYSQFASEHTNSEFLVLSDFLSIMSGQNGTIPTSPNLADMFPLNYGPIPEVKAEPLSAEQQLALQASSAKYTRNASIPQSRLPSNAPSRVQSRRQSPSGTTRPNNLAQSDGSSAHEKFFLTAADPKPESPEERLKQVINAKVEAGLMRPFDYVRGYARLQKYMDQNMSADSRNRILAPLSTFRPAFRAIAKRLTDVDLIIVEEAFERLLLDYDRVFTSMAVPACLWRRTGEIFRGNKEFAALLSLPVESLRDGKLAITELMAEDSAVNYWEKYGNIAFNGQQKAVLTSCLLQVPGDPKGAIVSCCFSFTIKRDRYNIPSCIVGNFIPISF